MKQIHPPTHKNGSKFLLRTSVVLMGLMFASPHVYADDDGHDTGSVDMFDKGSTGGATGSSPDFDNRSRQDTRRNFRQRGGYSLVYVNSPASEPDQIPAGTPAFTNVVDPRTLRVVKRIPVQDKPHHFYKVPNQNKAYLSHFGGTNVITVLDLVSNEVLKEIPTGDGPRHLTFSEDGKKAWSANLDNNSVSLIDTQTDKTLWTTPVTSRPNYVEQAYGYVFAANLGGSSLSVLDARTGQYKTDVQTGKKPFNMSVSCDGRLVMSANAGDNNVSFVDAATLTEVARVSIMGPISTAQMDTKVTQRLNPRVSPDCKYLWVGNQAAGTFAVLDIAQRKMVKEVKSAEKGGGSDIMFFIKKGPAAGMALGTNRYSRFVTMINPQPPFNVIKRIPAGLGTHYVWFNEDASHAYVSSRIEGSFSIIDLRGRNEVARKGRFGPIDQAAYVSFSREIVARSVGESGESK